MKKWILRETLNGAAAQTTSAPAFESAKVFSSLTTMNSHEVGKAHALGISPLLLHLLQLRGFVKESDIQAFLSPNLRLLAPLEEWTGLPQAAELIVNLLLEGKKLAVWGDYDVDGITSTALVQDVLEAHGFSVLAHIPERYSEGYGLNIANIDMLAEKGVQAILTVDCGVSDYESVAHAKKLGLSIIISDHHLPPEILPPADAICNPRMGDCPCADLAGVGITFFLMCAVNKALEEHTNVAFDMRTVLDLVAMGTLADMVALHGQNRILVKNGLLTIGDAKRPGLAALKTVCNFERSAKLGGGQIVFSLAPRINAAGRMGHAHLALELLRCKDFDTAVSLAKELDELNIQRRKDEERIHEEARVQAREQVAKGALGLVLYGHDWHQGIIGIVASRIVEEFYRPTLILCDGMTGIKGSGRSVKEFDLHEGLTKLADLLDSYGGHPLAAGLSIMPENLDALRHGFDAIAQECFEKTVPIPSLPIDAIIDFSAASNAIFLRELELLQPFGIGNSEPVFGSPLLRVKSMRFFGYTKEHVLLQVVDETTDVTLHAKVWRKASEFSPEIVGKYIYLAFTPLISTYNGMASVEVRVKDWNIVERAE